MTDEIEVIQSAVVTMSGFYNVIPGEDDLGRFRESVDRACERWRDKSLSIGVSDRLNKLDNSAEELDIRCIES